MTHIQYLRKKLSDTLRNQFGIYTNTSTGIKANLNGRSLKKLGSDKAVEKSKANGFSLLEHFEAAEKIIDLFREAILIETRPDKKGSRNILSIKIFSSKIQTINGKDAKVNITVKESIQNGHTIYSLELLELEQKNRQTIKSAE